MPPAFDPVVYLSFLLTPLGGLFILQVLLRTGWFTEGTDERKVPVLPTTTEYFVFKSRVHRWAVMAGFFLGWLLTVGVYIYVFDTFYFGR